MFSTPGLALATNVTSLLNKSSSLVVALGVTKFVTIKVMNFVTLSYAA
jgi:hypothetical protein